MVGRPTTSDRTNILSLSVVANLPLPAAALPQHPLLRAHIDEAIISTRRSSPTRIENRPSRGPICCVIAAAAA